MGWTKIPYAFSTFLHPCIYGEMARTENCTQNRAPWDRHEKGQKRARTTRSRDRFCDFSDKTGKNGKFHGPERVHLAKPAKTGHFSVKWLNSAKNGDLAMYLGREEGLEMPEMGKFLAFLTIFWTPVQAH